MKWFIFVFIILITAIGCKSNSSKVPESNQKHAENERKVEGLDPVHKAPPPAYGNKVVKNNKSRK